MKKKMVYSAAVAVWLCTLFSLNWVSQCLKYDTGAHLVEGKLNVHLVPHSHDDVGWLKTLDQYYVGSNTSIQKACVENILDSVVKALQYDPNRKFIFAEQAFFQRWWSTQTTQTQHEVKKLVNAGQLEFVNGGWVMHDEATCHYIDMIDQTTLGHRYIKEQFNITPVTGWQIDPFGHSAVQGYLLGVEVGLDSVHFARIDYQDRDKREAGKALEVVWRASHTFGASSQIFANAFPVHYSPPEGFHFEVKDDYSLIQDNPLLSDYNVEGRVDEFVKAAITQANVTKTNHIMWTMGDDFQYEYAESWFKQMDKLIHHVNKDGRVNAMYSTPTIYTRAKNAAAMESWPLKSHDYFPYADKNDSYWTGFFSSRPAFKGYVRKLSGYHLAARQIEYFVGRRSSGPNTLKLGESLAIAQHHDAVSGTAKQHVTDDYTKRLALGAAEAEAVVDSSLACLIDAKSRERCSAAKVSFKQCNLLNISYCPPTEQHIQQGKSLVMVAYNPLGWNRTEFIKIPVNSTDLVVRDHLGNPLEIQYIDVDDITKSVRIFYLGAYLGISSHNVSKYWLLFQASLPPLGWNTYFISKEMVKGNKDRHLSVLDLGLKSKVEVGPGDLKLTFSSRSGQLIHMFDHHTGVNAPIKQNFLWYNSHTYEPGVQASGAYIFSPDGDPSIVAKSVAMKVIRGPLMHEVHQQFAPWIYQVTRLYKEKSHIEVEYTIGPIPTDSIVGREVVTRINTDMATNKIFYTDSNGRDFLKRVRNHREDWNLSVSEPVAGNYYPLNLGMYIKDDKCELSVLVDRATGGASIKDGEIELMLHRRVMVDDSKGVGDPLDETVCVSDRCEGLTVRGKYYVGMDKVGGGAAEWRRTMGQEVYSPLLLAFTWEKLEEWKASYLTTASYMDSGYSLPPNVALITLQELQEKTVLLRLAHLYEAGEDAKHSTLAKVELKKVFPGKQIKEVKETNLSAVREKSEIKRMQWKVEGDKPSEVAAVRGRPVDPSTLIVELGPMEIRTFLLNF